MLEDLEVGCRELFAGEVLQMAGSRQGVNEFCLPPMLAARLLVQSLRGVACRYARWLDPAAGHMQAAPEGAILVLHACGHNPTGVDVSREQWAGLLAVAQRKRFLVLWDVAYQVCSSFPSRKDTTLHDVDLQTLLPLVGELCGTSVSPSHGPLASVELGTPLLHPLPARSTGSDSVLHPFTPPLLHRRALWSTWRRMPRASASLQPPIWRCWWRRRVVCVLFLLVVSSSL